MQESIDSINPTFWFFSQNEKLLEIIKNSNMVHSTARTLIPETFFDVKTFSDLEAKVHFEENDLIIIITDIPDSEWLPFFDMRIGVLQEKELLTYLQQGEDCKFYEEIYKLMCDQMNGQAHYIGSKKKCAD